MLEIQGRRGGGLLRLFLKEGGGMMGRVVDQRREVRLKKEEKEVR